MSLLEACWKPAWSLLELGACWQPAGNLLGPCWAGLGLAC